MKKIGDAGPGRKVLVQSGLLHCGGILMAKAGPGRWWVYVNVLSQILPQQYREPEIYEAAELADHGLCPSCAGLGYTGTDVTGRGPCGRCSGSGRTGLRVEKVHTDEGIAARVTPAGDPTAGVTCDLCVNALRIAV